MAYLCIKNANKECDGCMECKGSEPYYCEVCGEEVSERVYVSINGDIVGCENCIEEKEPCDVYET